MQAPQRGHLHVAAAGVLTVFGGWFYVVQKQLADACECGSPKSVCKESELANAYETVRQNVLHIAPQELCCRQCHETLLVPMGIIFPAKGDLFSVESKQAVIADGDTMRVPAQITENRGGARHCVLAVHDPVLTEQRSQECGKRFWVLQRTGCAAEAQLLSAIGAPEAIDKLAAKDSLEDAERQEEVIARMHPTTAIERKSAGGNEAVDMGMEKQVLSPGMQDGQEPDLSAQVLGIGGHLEQRFCCGPE
jgi:hypothetical protein